MILFALLAACAGIAVCTLLDMFYDQFSKWLRTLPKLLEKVIEGVLIGCKTFVDMTKSRFGIASELSKNYSKLGDKWQVTTATREVPMSDIPEEIQNRQTENNVLDITDELEMALK